MLSIKELMKKTGLSESTIKRRRAKGWDEAKIIAVPAQSTNQYTKKKVSKVSKVSKSLDDTFEISAFDMLKKNKKDIWIETEIKILYKADALASKVISVPGLKNGIWGIVHNEAKEPVLIHIASMRRVTKPNSKLSLNDVKNLALSLTKFFKEDGSVPYGTKRSEVIKIIKEAYVQ
jgi:hypothetical protein